MKRTFVMLWAIGMGQFALAQDSTVQKLEELMSAYGRLDKFSGSVLVARQGKVLLKGGYGLKNIKDSTFNDEHTVFQIASITKTFTAAMILKLVEQKKLALTDKVSKYYPGYPHGDSITIEHLLTHTSGIWDYTRDEDFRNNKQINGSVQVEELIRFFKDKPLDFAPGTAWAYSNSGYYLLGYIIQKVTAMPYEKAVRQYIFNPFGMSHSGFDFKHLASEDKAVGYYADSTEKPVKPTPMVDSASPYAAGSIYSTVEDLYRWHRGLQSYQFIGRRSLQQAYTPYKNRYGYGWIIDSLNGKLMVSHSGGIFGFRTDFARIPEDDICIVLLSNTEMPGISNITRRILAVLYGLPYAVPVEMKAVLVKEQVLKRYTGTYKIEQNGVLVDIVLENGKLLAKPHNGPVSELLALDESHFFLSNEQEFRIHFESDETGKVVRMMVNPDGDPKPAPKIK
jgi:CubicO group peptidase (beta-lactamase class C family)